MGVEAHRDWAEEILTRWTPKVLLRGGEGALPLTSGVGAMIVAAVVLHAASVALDPCHEAVVEWRAYQKILAFDPPLYPLSPPNTAAIARGSAKFDANTTFAAAYAQVRQRLDALALVAAARAGCEVERLGCFSSAELLLADLTAVQAAEAQPHWPGAWALLRRKTARRVLVNLVHGPPAPRPHGPPPPPPPSLPVPPSATPWVPLTRPGKGLAAGRMRGAGGCTGRGGAAEPRWTRCLRWA